MLETSLLFWLPSILIVTQNFGLSTGILVEKWFEQKKDHFNYYNQETWLMRYHENDEFYNQSGPIFIMIGGESEIMPDFIGNTTYLFETAKVHGAMMYSIEHRYYGKSHPVSDTRLENLKYLRVWQTLADIEFFIKTKKEELKNFEAFTMVFGCSYAGNLAAWMRVANPKLVQGALAGSAPVFLKADFFEFYELVEDAFRKYDEKCAINIGEAFSALEELLKNPLINSVKLAHDFKLCNVPDFDQPSEVSYLMINLAEIFANAVVHNTIEMNGKTSIENLCILMRQREPISAYYRLADVFKRKKLQNHCIFLKYDDLVERYSETSWESKMVEDRLWLYQTCTELGSHQTFSSSKSIFGSLLPQDYMMTLCEDVFQDFNLDHLNHNIKRLNDLYNLQLSYTKNIVFTNGDLDPWRSLSVLSDLNADSPAVVSEEFYEFVGDTIRKSDENGARNIKEAFTAVKEYLHHPKKLADDFKLCRIPNYDEPSEAEFLILTLAEMFADALVDFVGFVH